MQRSLTYWDRVQNKPIKIIGTHIVKEYNQTRKWQEVRLYLEDGRKVNVHSAYLKEMQDTCKAYERKQVDKWQNKLDLNQDAGEPAGRSEA